MFEVRKQAHTKKVETPVSESVKFTFKIDKSFLDRKELSDLREELLTGHVMAAYKDLVAFASTLMLTQNPGKKFSKSDYAVVADAFSQEYSKETPFFPTKVSKVLSSGILSFTYFK